MAQLGLNLGYLLVQILCFLILFVVVRVWIVKPLQTMLEKRRTTIAQGVEDARVAAEARNNAEKEAAGIISEAQATAAKIVSEATERADKAMEEFKADAEKEIMKERESALMDIEEERNRMLGNLRQEVATLSMAAAQKLIGESLNEKHQHALIDEFFSGVKAGKVVVLKGTEVAGSSAEVVSAIPLTKDEQASVKKDILSKVGKQATVSFLVDPSILGGLIVRVGDKVLDGSVSGKLEDLRQSLK